jgi:shikimate dehydrogenase
MKKFGVLGFPVGHSLSPLMHQSAIDFLEIDAVYEFCEVEPSKLNCFMKRVKTGEYAGLSVTVPYKEEVINHCDELTDVAARIGAVNTLYFDNNKLIGGNTDWYGFIRALEEGCLDFAAKEILIVGAGGAARACIYGLNQAGVKPYLVNRTKSKALELTEDFEVEVVDFKSLPKAQIVINCTSVGLKKDDPLLLTAEYLSNGVEVVFDLIYKNTPLVSEARKLVIKNVDAKRMLLWQGVMQFKKFTGMNAPVEVMWKSII